ncbi:unnamed protein product, partial [Musa hybrid cultivar]
MDGPDGFTAHAHTQPSPVSNSHTIPTPSRSHQTRRFHRRFWSLVGR